MKKIEINPQHSTDIPMKSGYNLWPKRLNVWINLAEPICSNKKNKAPKTTVKKPML